MFNFRNTHVWSDENPQALVEVKHWQCFNLNIWLCIKDKLLAAASLNFLENILLHFIWGFTFKSEVKSLVSERFFWEMNRIRGSKSPRSANLIPLNFCIWGYLKSLVYAVPVKRSSSEVFPDYIRSIRWRNP